MKHDTGGVTAPNVDEALIRAEVKKALVKMAAVKEDDVNVEPASVDSGAGNAAKPYVMQATISTHGRSTVAAQVADWEAKLLPVGRAIQKHYEQSASASIPAPDAFVVMVGIGSAKSSPDTIDLDFVVHGLDYSQVLPERKKAFLTEFATKVRDGIDAAPTLAVGISNVKARIHVIISPGADKSV